MVCSPEQEKVGTGSIEAIIYPVYSDLRIRATVSTLCEFRGRIDEALMDELIAIQAAAAMEAGLVSPAPLVIDTFPGEQGSQRVTDATTLYKAQKKSSR
jgi:hypothetical protein